MEGSSSAGGHAFTLRAFFAGFSSLTSPLGATSCCNGALVLALRFAGVGLSSISSAMTTCAATVDVSETFAFERVGLGLVAALGWEMVVRDSESVTTGAVPLGVTPFFIDLGFLVLDGDPRAIAGSALTGVEVVDRRGMMVMREGARGWGRCKVGRSRID